MSAEHPFVEGFCIPAVDIRDGRCVRLTKGDYSQETVYGDDPLAMALRWRDEGARRLHIVDLDGARDGYPRNASLAGRMVRELGLPIQWGGGIRTVEHARALLESGISRLIIGTVAIREPEVFAGLLSVGPERILVSLDCRGDRVAVAGWLEESAVAAVEVARDLASAGVGGFIATAIDRDGTLSGIDPAVGLAIAQATGRPVILAGGVASLADVSLALRHRESGIAGLVIGKALYAGTVDFGAAMRLAARPGI